jgi:aminoglycoside 3-N-acetyltransferase
MIRYEDIVSALKTVGLKRNDIVLVHSALGKLGRIKGIATDDRFKYIECIYNAFVEVIDIPHGTLIVPTFTHEYVRNKKPFIYEKSPSEVGAFTEYIRNRSDSYRSLHPINSFAAIGKWKYRICDNLNRSCYGYNSVFDRLIQLEAKMLFFGASMRHMTLKHHMEHVVGLPYTYHKAYFTKVYKDGKEVSLPFLCCVRYLNGKVENNDCSHFKRHIEKKKLLKQITLGGAQIIAVPIKSAFDVAYQLLQQDPCYFLEKPYYETV